jgi:anaerobic magnesium-protoporphyrin IX monomethyl ester cyclase
LVSFCDRARRSFYLSPSYLFYKLKQSLKDGRELQRNLKGFITLSKYLLRGSRHENDREPRAPQPTGGITSAVSAHGSD